MLGFIDGSSLCPAIFTDDTAATNKSVNPAYISWQTRDQLLLSWIFSSISPALVASLYGLESSLLTWQSLADRFASQSKSRISHIKRKLHNLQQGSLTCASYLAKTKLLADQLSVVGKLIDDDDLISFIIGGLNNTFTQFITSYSFHTRENSMSFFLFQNNQMRIMLLQGPSENGLYPINLNNLSHNKCRGLTAFMGIKAPSSLSHQRLGHPSESVLCHVLSKSKLPLAGSLQKNFVCESCQLGKSIQQPFPSSHRETSGPLALVHSDV
ncbi:hypothetical protein SADUNF_Sadunf17G0100400 [Salix dunnii]|uniref:GAG-pre-integrase domain-containing protein n=1 Tax=Salix dunnii TaxID=1413687 RepID=A0A835J3I4_9ROSI|nr:hypothetical protein SADUNF_Sadunf17G0100400 [Salix dunnii]